MADELKNDVTGLKIGEKLTSLRKSRNMSRKELAEKSGIADVVISQIESDIISPTVAALLKLARALGSDLGYFFQEGAEDLSVEIVRGNERKTVKRKRASGDYALSYSYQSLSYRKANKHMQPFLVEFDIDIEEDIELLTHEGEEFLYLLSGELEMRTGDQVIILREGDSVYFDSTTPHGFVGRGNRKPRAVVAVYTPERSIYD